MKVEPMGVHIARATVRLREMVAADQGLAKLLDEPERRIGFVSDD